MRELNRDELRLLFMREGKIAAPLWSLLDDEPSEAVSAQARALIDAVEAEFLRLREEDRDALLSVFHGAARKARTPEPPTAERAAEVTPEAVRSRVEMLRGAPARALAEREASWRRPSANSLAVVTAVCANPGEGVSESDAALLYKEIGRLTGSLWITGDWDHVPDLTLIAANSLDATLGVIVVPERRFDETRHEFRVPPPDVVLETLHAELFDSLRAARRLYFADHPVGGALPSDPVSRRAEEERRAAERAAVVERAMEAVDLIVQPLLDAVGAYVATRAAEAAAQEAAEREVQAQARAAAGFARPEPQRYGVSARGAELWVADALRWLGEHDVEVTRQSADGGVDVMSARLAVSVKHYSGAVPVEEIREIFGVAAATRRRAVLWTSGTLTEQARQFADLAPVAIVTYDVETAQWEGANAAGAAFLAEFEVLSET